MDGVTIFQLVANQSNWTQARITTDGTVLDVGSSISIQIILSDNLGIPIQVLEVTEQPPIPFDFATFLQYLVFKLDREYQNYVFSMSQQGDNDFRIQFRPRVDASLLVTVAIEFAPIWTDAKPDGEAMYKYIEDIIRGPRWVYQEYPPLQSFRVTDDGSSRVTASGDVRVSNYSLEAEQMIRAGLLKPVLYEALYG